MSVSDIPPIFKAVVSPDGVKEDSWKARLVLCNGEVVEISYRKPLEEETESENTVFIPLQESTVVLQVSDYYKIFFNLPIENKELVSHLLAQVLQNATVTSSEDFGKASEAARVALQKIQKAHAIFQKKETRARHGVRAFHVITGVLSTPLTMVSGMARVAIRCAQVAGLALAFPIIKLKERVSKKAVPIDGHRTSERVVSLIHSALHDVRIGLLQMIPFVGTQLAALYRSSQSWSNFLDAPGIGGLLDEMGASVRKIIYCTSRRSNSRVGGGRMRPDENKYVGDYIQPYLNEKNPTFETTCRYIEKHLATPSSLKSQPLPVRIPVKGAHGKVRYHDGTMYFASKDKNGKTVVLYHGNDDPRDACKEMAQKYLQHGYNVLLASYAGDLVVSGNGKSHSYKGSACSERAMIEDAKADVDFLKGLGVQRVAVEGLSLGELNR